MSCEKSKEFYGSIIPFYFFSKIYKCTLPKPISRYIHMKYFKILLVAILKILYTKRMAVLLSSYTSSNDSTVHNAQWYNKLDFVIAYMKCNTRPFH